MRKEKLVLSVGAALIGIAVALVGFFFYQSTKRISDDRIKSLNILNPSPSPTPSIFLSITEPTDEAVVNKRIIKVAGKTNPDAKILIVTEESEQSAVASSDGAFSTDITLSEDENILDITSIAPNGESVTIRRTVTYSTESF